MQARLTRLKINRFRDTQPTELHFNAGFNVLLGLNGTGKTTLLDLIAAICSDDLSSYAKEAFDVEYEVRSTSPRRRRLSFIRAGSRATKRRARP